MIIMIMPFLGLALLLGNLCASEITGQVFITPKNRQTVKLSECPILIVDRDYALGYMDKYRKFRQKRKEYNQLNTDITGKARSIALYATYAKKYSKEGNELIEKLRRPNITESESNGWTLLLRKSNTNESKALTAYHTVIQQTNDLYVQLGTVQKELDELANQLGPYFTNKYFNLKKRLDSIPSGRTSTSSELANLKLSLEIMQSIQLSRFLADANFWKDNVIASTMTDADGNYTVSYNYTKPVVVVSWGQRAVFDKTEHYFWMVESDETINKKLFLNTSNLMDE